MSSAALMVLSGVIIASKRIMKSSNLKRLCYVVLAFVLAFSMSSCKREDIVSNTVVDSTESTSLCETESATENVNESFSADSEPASKLRSIEKIQPNRST